MSIMNDNCTEKLNYYHMMTGNYYAGPSSGKRNVTVWHRSICPASILTVTHQGAACDSPTKYFSPTISRTCHNCTKTDYNDNKFILLKSINKTTPKILLLCTDMRHVSLGR